ncbi:hypothetical protein DM860_007235 [Cuscuta australis]|uniref:Reverse transcriptase zinc-binding domain-containing protein n=1 Tax=Cuscuta australis TaxID=267555 RepID=A0A328E6V2_9ASTE|nr:hypothetical protein DM860_007235 [Cuscuta australis]
MVVETDSMELLHMLRDVPTSNTLLFIKEKIETLNLRLSHTLKEANGAADLLAKQGARNSQCVYFDCFSSLPRAISTEVNFSKSCFFAGKHSSPSTIARMTKALNMKHEKLPFSYLGVTICKGKLKKGHCQGLIKHFDVYLSSWYSKMLTPMGRLLLIKHVLSSIPLHYMAVQSLPISIINLLHRNMANFFWGYNNGRPKHHWRSWESLCCTKEEGGIGIRNLKDLHQAYSLKLWWKAHKDDTLWARFIREKYIRRNSYQEGLVDSPTWKRICRIANSADEHSFSTNGILSWEDGEFTLKKGYNVVRDTGNTQISYKFAWQKLQIPQIRVFQWKVFNEILPFPQLLRKLGYQLPSQCPLCKNHETSTNHTLLHCHFSSRYWNFFTILLQGPCKRDGISLRQHILEWNLRSSSKTIRGNLKMVIAGIIAWHLWKTYNAALYSEEQPSVTKVLHNIKTTIQNWCWNNRDKRWMNKDSKLFELGFQTVYLNRYQLNSFRDVSRNQPIYILYLRQPNPPVQQLPRTKNTHQAAARSEETAGRETNLGSSSSSSPWKFGSQAQGWMLLIFGSVSFILFAFAAGLSKLLPASGNPIIAAIQNDRYYCFLVPLTLPVLVVAVYFPWLSMKLFKHAYDVSYVSENLHYDNGGTRELR